VSGRFRTGLRFVICAVRKADRLGFLYTGVGGRFNPPHSTYANNPGMFRPNTCLIHSRLWTSAARQKLGVAWDEPMPCFAGLTYSMRPVISDLSENRASRAAVCHVPIGRSYHLEQLPYKTTRDTSRW